MTQGVWGTWLLNSRPMQIHEGFHMLIHVLSPISTCSTIFHIQIQKRKFNFNIMTWLHDVLIISTVKAPVFGTLNSAISNFQTRFVRTVMEVLKYCWM